jgi:putative membrane protein
MIVSDVNHSEIDAGKLAQSHAKNAKVKQFAQHMITGHSTVEGQLVALEKAENITPADSPVSTKLADQSRSTKQSLEGQSGGDFDRAYIATQLQGHQDVLDLIDTKLMPQAQDPKLRASLASIRTKVVAHIQMAKDAQAALPSQ